MRQVYLDYSATTPVKEEVLQEMIPYFTEQFGNPSSLYTMGLTSKEAVDKARSQVAALIGADSKEIYFTGCGSEADNWAVFGTVDKFKEKGNHIITTRIEHHAMLHSCEFLEKNGYKVTYLAVEPDGTVKPETLEAAITDQTILISIMMVNNEVGTIEPIKELAAIAKKHGILFHTDAVQALANVPIDVKDLGVDMLSVSAHKIYGPKGIGALYIRKGLRISNYMHGGAQEMGRRAGTENLAGIVGFGKAAELAKINMEEHIAHCSQLRDYLIDRITREIPDTFVNGTMEHRHPGNANITFKYIEGESILLLLDYKGVSVSTGSACSSKSLEPSHVLTALGVPVEMVHGTVRFTVGDFTTKEDIDYVIESLKEIVEKLRALSPVNSEKGW
ncbi:cysteine desulfurase NifS [Emergencia sp. JLR.KK010]|uniref:cysteine desulfurase NifS n=1 Tax=Emergencia sp. JLR.KK010 TaxID=3114296 RepID=UPI0030CC3A2E